MHVAPDCVPMAVWLKVCGPVVISGNTMLLRELRFDVNGPFQPHSDNSLIGEGPTVWVLPVQALDEFRVTFHSAVVDVVPQGGRRPTSM